MDHANDNRPPPLDPLDFLKEGETADMKAERIKRLSRPMWAYDWRKRLYGHGLKIMPKR